jgi:hypothetical protein
MTATSFPCFPVLIIPILCSSHPSYVHRTHPLFIVPILCSSYPSTRPPPTHLFPDPAKCPAPRTPPLPIPSQPYTMASHYQPLVYPISRPWRAHRRCVSKSISPKAAVFALLGTSGKKNKRKKRKGSRGFPEPKRPPILPSW